MIRWNWNLSKCNCMSSVQLKNNANYSHFFYHRISDKVCSSAYCQSKDYMMIGSDQRLKLSWRDSGDVDFSATTLQTSASEFTWPTFKHALSQTSLLQKRKDIFLMLRYSRRLARNFFFKFARLIHVFHQATVWSLGPQKLNSSAERLFNICFNIVWKFSALTKYVLYKLSFSEPLSRISQIQFGYDSTTIRLWFDYNSAISRHYSTWC